MMTFARKVDFWYKCVFVDKRYITSPFQFAERLKEILVSFAETYKQVLERLDSVKIYYDCGQSAVTNILHEVFEGSLSCEVEFAQDVHPSKYRLFQTATGIYV